MASGAGSEELTTASYILSLSLNVSWSGPVRCVVPPESWSVERFEMDPPVTVEPTVTSSFEVARREYLWQRYAGLHQRLMKFTPPTMCDPASKAGAMVSLRDLAQRPRVIGSLVLKGEGWFAQPAEATDVALSDSGGAVEVDARWRLSLEKVTAPGKDGADADFLEVTVSRKELRPEGPFPHPDRLTDLPVGVTLMAAGGEFMVELPLGWVSPEAAVYDEAVERYLVRMPLQAVGGAAGFQAAKVWFIPAVQRREVVVALDEVEVP